MSEVTIRMATEEDLVAINSIYNHYIAHTAITFDVEPWPMSKRESWFNHYNLNGRHWLFVALVNNELVGYATSSAIKDKAAYNSSVEVSVYLSPEQKAKGIGSQLYRTLLPKLKANGIHRAYALITCPNDASDSFHEKFGFQQVSRLDQVGFKFGKFHDTKWFQLKLDQWQDKVD